MVFIETFAHIARQAIAVTGLSCRNSEGRQTHWQATTRGCHEVNNGSSGMAIERFLS